MLMKIENLPKGILGVRASGKLTKEDYQTVLEPLLEEIHSKGERIKVLYHIADDFDGYTAGAAWEDFTVGLKHLRLFEKCAVVSNEDWINKATSFIGALMPCPVRSFPNVQYEESIKWLNESPLSTLEFRLDSKTKTLIIEPKAPLQKADFDRLAFVVDPWIEAHGNLNGLVIHTPDFPGWQNFGTIVRHFQFIKLHHEKIRKIALCADGVAPSIGKVLAGHFIKAEIKQFSFGELDSALEWISKQ